MDINLYACKHKSPTGMKTPAASDCVQFALSGGSRLFRMSSKRRASVLRGLCKIAPALLVCAFGSLSLSSCLSVVYVSTPTPTLRPPTLTPTFVFPTLIPTVTITPEPKPSPTPDLFAGLGSVIYHETFSRDSGWGTVEDPRGVVSLQDGKLTIVVHQPETFRYSPSPRLELQDFYLELTAHTEICSPDDQYGIMFRVNPDNEHYRFMLYCDGGAKVSRFIQDSKSILIPKTETFVVFPGSPADNRLGIWASGDEFRFYINEIEVFSTRDNKIASGKLGLIVQTGDTGLTTISFDGLTVWSLIPATQPAITSTP